MFKNTSTLYHGSVSQGMRELSKALAPLADLRAQIGCLRALDAQITRLGEDSWIACIRIRDLGKALSGLATLCPGICAPGGNPTQPRSPGEPLRNSPANRPWSLDGLANWFPAVVTSIAATGTIAGWFPGAMRRLEGWLGAAADAIKGIAEAVGLTDLLSGAVAALGSAFETASLFAAGLVSVLAGLAGALAGLGWAPIAAIAALAVATDLIYHRWQAIKSLFEGGWSPTAREAAEAVSAVRTSLVAALNRLKVDLGRAVNWIRAVEASVSHGTSRKNISNSHYALDALKQLPSSLGNWNQPRTDSRQVREMHRPSLLETVRQSAQPAGTLRMMRHAAAGVALIAPLTAASAPRIAGARWNVEPAAIASSSRAPIAITIGAPHITVNAADCVDSRAIARMIAEAIASGSLSDELFAAVARARAKRVRTDF